MTQTKTVLTNDEAAALIGIAPSTLKLYRHLGRGPRFIKLGLSKNAGVVYERADVEGWKEERKFASTAEYSAAARHSQDRARNINPAPKSRIDDPWLRSNGQWGIQCSTDQPA